METPRLDDANRISFSARKPVLPTLCIGLYTAALVATGCSSFEEASTRTDTYSRASTSDVPSPIVRAVTPNAAAAAGGQTITVHGTGFVDGSTSITVNGVPATNVIVKSSSTVTFTSPAFASLSGSSVAQPLVVTVGGNAATFSAGFYYYPSTHQVLQELSADVGLETTTAGTVSAWADQSGNGHAMTQSVAASQPTLTSNYNGTGHPALEFNGNQTSGQFMTSSLGANVPQPMTIYVTGDVLQWSPTNQFAKTFYSDGADLNYVGPSLFAKSASTVAWASKEDYVIHSFPPAGTNVLAVVFNGATSSYWVNGTQVGGTLDVGTAGTGGLELGAFLNGSTNINFLNGHIAELRVIGNVESPADIATTSAIMQARWSPAATCVSSAG